MSRLTFWIQCLLVMLSMAPLQRVTACSCFQEHPQTQFCRADFVAVVRVKRRVPVSEEGLAFKVKINKIFKSNAKSEVALKENILWTPAFDSMCGVNLNVGETYVVSGRVISGQASVSLCGISQRWSDVSGRQRKAFRRLYHSECGCEIMYTPWLRKGVVLEMAGGKRCLWESTPGPQVCQEKYGVCMAVPGGCSWAPSVPYKNCIKEHQRQREQQRSRSL